MLLSLGFPTSLVQQKCFLLSYYVLLTVNVYLEVFSIPQTPCCYQYIMHMFSAILLNVDLIRLVVIEGSQIRPQGKTEMTPVIMWTLLSLSPRLLEMQTTTGICSKSCITRPRYMSGDATGNNLWTRALTGDDATGLV